MQLTFRLHLQRAKKKSRLISPRLHTISIMKLASLKSDNRDGKLVVVSKNLEKAVLASDIAETMIELLENWDSLSPRLEDLYIQLNAKIKQIMTTPS